MKRILTFFLFFTMIFLFSCSNYKEMDYYFDEYLVYYQSHGNCEMYINEIIYTDVDHIYMLGAGGCGGDSFYYIKPENEYVNIPTALEEGIISIADVIASGLPAVNIEDTVCTITTSAEDTVIGEINGYEIRRSLAFCDAVVGQIVVDGFDFGFFSSGCDANLNSIGYYAVKDNIDYELKELVDDGIITTEQIFDIYKCDEGRLGE
ncbi:hypothetical protein RJI07_06255 [Mycoplasmatota bacterium WC30]